MAIHEANSPTTRLLTLLNVSALKTNKRKRPIEDEFTPAPKLNKRKPAVPVDQETQADDVAKPVEADPEEYVDGNGNEAEDLPSSYELHFGNTPSVLSEASLSSIEHSKWKTSKIKQGKLGNLLSLVPEQGSSDGIELSKVNISDKLKKGFKTRQSHGHKDQTDFQNDLLPLLSSHKDLCLVGTPIDYLNCTRECLSLHLLDHVTRKRRKVLKNNEKVSHSKKSDPDAPPLEDVQDQGFTRPSVLVLLPFRSSAVNWFNAITSHTSSLSYQIENASRFHAEYGLPEGAVDKLATAAPGTYPRDHVETFKGNVDDNFRLGIKMTKKSMKIFAEFYSCDIILASPLGLRMTIEKEKNADFLSSIEIMVMDQVDTLTMQNWEHVQFVMSHLNGLPKEAHDADFSRIKPWYLDGRSVNLRQTILLTDYETPEIRSLFNTGLKNASGKVRTDLRYPPIQVPEGVNQDFISFSCSGPKDEPDRRFNHFTTQVLPSILNSAVQSANTVIFIPSSFDFIRVHNYCRKQQGLSFTVLSEYSSNQDISRARQAFFNGKKSLLLVSERFHFFKRYRIRGIRNVVFYAPPDHPQFYTEFLSYPFLDEGVEAGDVTSKILYSKYDWFRMQRIVGTEAARELIGSQ